MLALHFMVNALRAGTIVAVIAGAIGWFMVLRRQSFAGHTLAVVSFPGAAAAIWLGVSATAGYFAGSIVAALVIAMVPRSSSGRARSEESAVIGTVQAFALACGVLFVSLYGGFLDSLTGLLFGTFLGISDGQVVTLALVAGGVLLGAGRASPGPCSSPRSTPMWPRPGGVPVRALSVVFLLLLGCAAAEVSQITGALLVFALLVMPAAAAQQITARPALSLALTVVLAVAITWAVPRGGLLLGLSGGLLRLLLRVRRLCAGRGRAGPGLLARLPRPGTVRSARWPAAPPGPLLRRWADDEVDGLDLPWPPRSIRSSVWPTCSTTPSCARPSWPAPASPWPPGWSATSWCSGARCSRGRALPRGLHRGPGRPGLRRRPPGRSLRGVCGASPCSWPSWAAGRRPTTPSSGSVFAWVLGLGALFLSVFTTSQSGTGAVGSDAGVNVLFGSILGLSSASGPGRLVGGAGGRGGLRGHRPAPGLRQPRRAGGRGPGRARTGPGLRLLRPAGRDRRRGHPGRGGPAAPGTRGRAGRGQPAADARARSWPSGCRPPSPWGPCGSDSRCPTWPPGCPPALGSWLSPPPPTWAPSPPPPGPGRGGAPGGPGGPGPDPGRDRA